MKQNVYVWLFLTVSCLLSGVSCKSDHIQEEESDPETQYFEDYESPRDKWGFLNTEGEITIQPKYDLVSGFKEGLAPVNLAGRWGFINHRDSAVIPFEFRAAWQFQDGLARVIDFAGTPCFIRKNGTKICPPDITDLSDFSEGYAVFEQRRLFGYMNTAGVIAIAPQFDQAWKFEQGAARVTFNGKQGLIDTSGMFIIPAAYEKVYAPSSGRILVKESGRYHFLDMHGTVMSAWYAHATPYAGEIAAVADESGWFLIDLQDKPLIEARYTNMRPAGEQRWVARTDSLLALTDGQGNILTPFQYAQINNFSEGFAGYMRNGLWGFIDVSGKELTPPQFGLVWDFHEGLARAAFQNGIAFLTPSGEVPFSPHFYEMRDFSEGLVSFQE